MPAPLAFSASTGLPRVRRVSNPALTVAIALTVAAMSVTWILLWRGDPRISEEGGRLEWGQIILLGLGATGLLVKLRRQKPALEDRLIWLGLSLFMASLVSREIEVRLMGLGPLALAVEKGYRVVLAICWNVYLFKALPRWPELLRHARPFGTSRLGVLFLAGAVMYLSSWGFDRFHFMKSPELQRFIEELIEFHATFLMSLAVMFASRENGGSITTP